MCVNIVVIIVFVAKYCCYAMVFSNEWLDVTKKLLVLMAAIAGVATAARLGVGQSTARQGYEMDAIAAVIIGGASVSGGNGTVMGVIIGAAIMGVLNNGLVLLNVSAYWQQAVLGVVIIAAVSFDKLQSKRKSGK